jgi:hypothetical protein
MRNKNLNPAKKKWWCLLKKVYTLSIKNRWMSEAKAGHIATPSPTYTTSLHIRTTQRDKKYRY